MSWIVLLACLPLQLQEPTASLFDVTEPIGCKVVRGYEDYEPLDAAEVARDQKLLLYTRPSGYQINEAEGRYRAHLVEDVQVRRPGKKKVVWSRKRIIDFKAEDDQPPRRLYLATTIGVKGFEPGEYEIDLALHDALGGGSPIVRTYHCRVTPSRAKEQGKRADKSGNAER